MVNIWDRDYVGNPDNQFYVSSAKQTNMDWKDFREMYNSLHLDVKEELDKYLFSVVSMELGQDLRKLVMLEENARKATRLHLIKFGAVA